MEPFKLKASIPVDDLPEYLRQWERSQPNLCTVREIGRSGTYPILAAIFTDQAVSDDDKQVAMIVAQHTLEVSGVNTVLSIGNYLAANDDTAAMILKQQIVVLVPCPNPYSYATQSEEFHFRNEAGLDEYTAFTDAGVIDSEKAPSAAAIQSLIDRWRPELLLDCHGRPYEDEIVVDSVGMSTFLANKLYDRRFATAMNQAARDHGYAVYDEESMQRHRIGPDDVSADERARYDAGRGGCLTANVYAYQRYHTLGGSLEVSWEESGFLKVRRALELGCTRWAEEQFIGYPTSTVCSGFNFNSIRAWGETAAQRRDSRVEIWAAAESHSFGNIHPEKPGFAGLVFATSTEVCRRVIGTQTRGLPVGDLLTALETEDEIAVPPMREMVRERGPIFLNMRIVGSGDTVVEHGVVVRFSLPYAQAQPTQVLINGNVVNEGAGDGYHMIRHDSWTHLDIAIPPGRCPKFIIAMVAYDCERKKTGILEFPQ